MFSSSRNSQATDPQIVEYKKQVIKRPRIGTPQIDLAPIRKWLAEKPGAILTCITTIATLAKQPNIKMTKDDELLLSAFQQTCFLMIKTYEDTQHSLYANFADLLLLTLNTLTIKIFANIIDEPQHHASAPEKKPSASAPQKQSLQMNYDHLFTLLQQIIATETL